MNSQKLHWQKILDISPAYMKKLQAHFGDSLFYVLDNEPEKILNVRGIGPDRAKKIQRTWFKNKQLIDFLEEWPELELTTYQLKLLRKKFNNDVSQKIISNPYYWLALIPSMSFFEIDNILLQRQQSTTPELRCLGAIYATLNQALTEGHIGLPIANTQQKVRDKLMLDESTIEKHFLSLTQNSDFCSDGSFIYLPEIFKKQKEMVQKIHRMIERQPKDGFSKYESFLKTWEEQNFPLSASQLKAVETILSSSISLLTGGPGVGKTQTIAAICALLFQTGKEFALAAPTGRAAKRLSELTYQPAKTLHRLLEYVPEKEQFQKNKYNKLDLDYLIVDELSMVDFDLFYQIIDALPLSCCLVLVGDPNQLPSIGPGQILSDLIQSESIPTTHLTEIFRQQNGSQICEIAHQILAKEMQEKDLSSEQNSDFFFIETPNDQRILEKIHQLMTDKIATSFGFDPLHDIEILAPMRKGEVGIDNLNQSLQDWLNPNGMKCDFTKHAFRIGDKVMQIQNNYEKNIYNGDIGYIEFINTEKKLLKVKFDEETIITYRPSELDQLQFAYAITIHKSQGSEYPVVILPFSQTHHHMWNNQLLYTALTRGKQLVIILGQKSYFLNRIQSSDHHIQKRFSNMIENIKSNLVTAA